LDSKNSGNCSISSSWKTTGEPATANQNDQRGLDKRIGQNSGNRTTVLNDTIGFNKKDQNMGQTGKKT
jgi:hypothetical protein